MTTSPQTRRFAALATEYCELLDHLAEVPTDVERWRLIARLLARLVAAALDLPNLGPTARERSDPTVKPPELDLGPIDSYREVFDPFDVKDLGAPPAMGSLLDDLQDTYCDLRRGLALYKDGAPDDVADAVWCWRFLFAIHWGEHATGALRALYWAIRSSQ